jgi:hypothetical protein
MPKPHSRADRLIPIGQVAVRIREPRERLRRLIELGDVAGEFVGTRLFIRESEVERLESERKSRSPNVGAA